ncbi:MAG: hypothetical protein C4536_06430 [Actinobacteria bacterium]|nr:MAG: hypothetical protein C4536_06430 [Actinomycetota bacterium]
MRIEKALPYSIKTAIGQMAWLDTPRARMLARTSKRIDICAAQFAHVLHLCDHPSLEGKTCLEIGEVVGVRWTAFCDP